MVFKISAQVCGSGFYEPYGSVRGGVLIIRNPDDVTAAVLEELERAPNPRFKEVMSGAVRHLHAFVRETCLSEAEFQQACAYIAKLGQLTTASHNEVVLIAGSLGVSSLVCQINNGSSAESATTANLLGPFWRKDSPMMKNGDSIARLPSIGEPVFVKVRVVDRQGSPIVGAEVDVWQASDEGFYENQDSSQPEMNLRGKFLTDDEGYIAFRSIKPRGYPIPVSGPVGDLLRAQGRHNLRPAHIHFLVFKPGYKTQFAQVYSGDDPHLETDVQFGVTHALIGRYLRYEYGSQPPPAPDIHGAWYTLDHNLIIEPGEAKLPRPPVYEKALGDRPKLAVLERITARG